MQTITRRLLILALIGVVIACIGSQLAKGTATRRAATYTLATSAIGELALLAGVADDSGVLQRDEPMPVEVISDGGPLWALDSVEAAVSSSRYFSVGNSPHLLRTELVEARGGIALQLHLWRSGWEIREPLPRRIRISPASVVLAGIVGAAISLLTRRMSLGLATAGVLAQVMLAIDPMPLDLFPPQRLSEAWASAPLVDRTVSAIRGMETLGMGVVAAVGAGSLVLVAFDHKRTRGGDDDLGLAVATLAAFFGLIGVVAFIEAASRGGLFAACDVRFGAWAGWLALLGLILAWLPAIRVAPIRWPGGQGAGRSQA
jgi:hypothetical protein